MTRPDARPADVILRTGKRLRILAHVRTWRGAARFAKPGSTIRGDRDAILALGGRLTLRDGVLYLQHDDGRLIAPVEVRP